MADELMQTGIFEGMTWWNTNPAKSFLLAPYCSMAVGGGGGGVDGFASVGDNLMNHNRSSVAPRSTYNLFEDPPMADSSILQAMAFDASNTWNHQDIMHGGSCDGDYVNNGIINPIMDAGEWNTSNTCGGGSELNCSSSPPPAAVNSSGTEGSTVTCDGQVPVISSFPVDPSSMFQNSLLNGDNEILIPSCEWISTIDHNQVLDSSFNQQQRQEQIFNHLRATLLGGSPASSSPPSPKPQSRKSTNSKKVNKNDEGSDSGSVGSKNGGELSIKRQRIETPSSLPTFKVRKEKLGDRITALQQLVSPFGKTDTASVLHEAIEYIKFLHDQVNALSTPYMKNGAPVQHHQQGKGEVGTNQDLSSRGLCLMPISSTFPVAHDSPADFWTPTFGATFR